MLFSSLTFLFGFLPILLLGYYVVPSRKFKNCILLVFSLLFYAWGEPKYILLMLVTILISYIMGLLINKYDSKPKVKKLLLTMSIILILAGLIFFKYTNFILENITRVTKADITFMDIILPIGISFYSFQILSYVIDLYNKKVEVQRNIFSLALYVSLFPQLIAGPIVRYETVEDELKNRKENLPDILSGFKRFIVGLSKKIIIANNMGLIADSIFVLNNSNIGTLIMWLGVLAYTLQIYFDFSGYSDMAIGLGKMFGFHFLENFNYPYIAKSITDFWRRWHISLSSWFRDYIYIPLGGNRVSKLKWIRNICVVWLLTGLWHGASWNFVLWGAYFAIILLIEKIFLLKFIEKSPKIIQWLYAIFLIMLGWVIFRCESMELMKNVLSKMFVYQKSDLLKFITENINLLFSMLFILPAIVVSFPIVPKLKEKFNKSIIMYAGYNLLILILFSINIVFLTSSSYNPFIYFRF
ncbi:MAG: MBOAT family protein [Clostridia bacterium]|jgi:alginate O-acetyltransferase complex protein AlgI|nr:MBOAT family protein [Clostridia bacterium]